MQRCSVCLHPKRDKIEQELLASGSLRSGAAHYGLTASAVCRHKKKHIQQSLQRAQEAHEVRQASRTLDALNSLYDRTERFLRVAEEVLQQARENADPKLILSALHESVGLVREMRGHLALASELSGEKKQVGECGQAQLLIVIPGPQGPTELGYKPQSHLPPADAHSLTEPAERQGQDWPTGPVPPASRAGGHQSSSFARTVPEPKALTS